MVGIHQRWVACCRAIAKVAEGVIYNEFSRICFHSIFVIPAAYRYWSGCQMNTQEKKHKPPELESKALSGR